MAFFRKDLGIDLGTASILVYVKDEGIVLNEPSVIAIQAGTGELLSVGSEAKDMLGRTPGSITAIRPMKNGVISNYDITEKMLKHFIHKTVGRSIIKPRVIVCVPSGITEVEKRAVLEACRSAGASKTFVIEEPIAAAIGAGVDITEPNGNMIIDIGGGTSDIAVISLGGIVINKSLKVAGDDCNEAIVRYIRKKYNMMIGERSAEDLKMHIGGVYPRKQEVTREVRGRNLLTGLPETIKVSSREMEEALEEPVSQIVDAVHYVLERTPPELAADISNTGILMTGGGALLYGLDKLIEERTGIEVNIAEDAVEAVAIGTGRSLEWVDMLGKNHITTDAASQNEE